MGYLKKNSLALILLSLLLVNEVGHLAFKDISFNENVNLDVPVFYLTLAIRNVFTSIFIYILVPKVNYSTKCILLGVICWNLIELYQEFCYITQVSKVVLFFNDGLWGQISFIFTIIGLSAYGYSKYKS